MLYSCETCICPGKRHLPNNTGTALKRVFAQENAIYPAILVHVFIFVFVFVFFFFRPQVVIDAFRLINPNMMVLGQESRQTTSNLGHLQKPSIQVSLLKN